MGALDRALTRETAGLDRSALEMVWENWTKLEANQDPQDRGRRLDGWIASLLNAHRCKVETGKFIPGEQVDVFVHKPFRAVVECRWESKPVGVSAISSLIQKLLRDRPAIVSGIYVSVNGFTGPARREAAQQAKERVVVLFDREDLMRMAQGSIHVVDLFDERVDTLVRRY